jgi:hypothetical protein
VGKPLWVPLQVTLEEEIRRRFSGGQAAGAGFRRFESDPLRALMWNYSMSGDAGSSILIFFFFARIFTMAS